MSEIKLKPCPFCGCHDRRVGIRKMGNKGYRIVCGRCGTGGPYVPTLSVGGDKMLAQDKAKVDWNRRAGNETD